MKDGLADWLALSSRNNRHNQGFARKKNRFFRTGNYITGAGVSSINGVDPIGWVVFGNNTGGCEKHGYWATGVVVGIFVEHLIGNLVGVTKILTHDGVFEPKVCRLSDPCAVDTFKNVENVFCRKDEIFTRLSR